MDYRTASTEVKELSRNSYGSGSRQEELEADIGEKKTTLEVEIPERAYTAEEIQSMFDRSIKRLDTVILGENKTLDRIDEDMELVTQLSGEPLEISWELSRYDVMNVQGELQEDALDTKESAVTLQAVLTYTQDKEKQALYECTALVYPKKLSELQKWEEKIKAAIAGEGEKSKTEQTLKLPDKVDGESVRYFYPMDERGLLLILMGVLTGLLLYALEKQNAGKALQKKEEQLLLDYPEVIHKLTLFMGAGMTVKRAWKKIVADYEEQKEVWGERFVYEEMKQTCHEMESGIMESESYERFGRRCRVQEYVRLGALLSQNLRKGTKGMSQLLKLEAVQAFENRKARAKRRGEEAGTKLLAPMFLMLAVVLFIVVVPAFMSVQI